MKENQKIRAFTLVELMFATVVLGVISIAFTAFMTDSARGMLWSVNKSMIVNDFREFTAEISQDATGSSIAYLYPSFDLGDTNNANDRRGIGLSGDCLVLITTVPFPETNSPRFYERIIVYYRASGGNIERPVFRIELDLPELNIPITTNVEGLLASQRNNFSNPVTVLELSRGLSQNQIFFRATEESFVINGEIIHGENDQRITNTYNLTISTRG